MSDAQKQVLAENTARNMNGVTDNIKYRHAAHCYLADADYGDRVCTQIGLDKAEAQRLAKPSYNELMEETKAK